MPTPFNHLVHAERLLKHESMPEPALSLLQAQRPAFLLGNTAPDLASVSANAREQTHFFSVPLRRAHPAHLRMLAEHPQLAQPSHLPPAQSAFVAGYLVHLWLDQAWIASIFAPYFGLGLGYSGFRRRLIDHNLVRAFADERDFLNLPDDVHEALSRAKPEAWLPFARDEDILHWREYLVEQLAPGAHSRTVEVFADRLGMAPEKFAEELHSESRMAAILGKRLPSESLSVFWGRAQAATAELVRYYLEERVHEAPLTAAPISRLMASDPVEPGDNHESPRAI